MKENLAKEILKVTAKNQDLQNPLKMENSYRLFLHLQTLRYLFAIYGKKELALSNVSCPESFTRYLKAVIKISDNVYNWPKDDYEYLNKLSFQTPITEDSLKVFNQLKLNFRSVPYYVN